MYITTISYGEIAGRGKTDKERESMRERTNNRGYALHNKREPWRTRAGLYECAYDSVAAHARREINECVQERTATANPSTLAPRLPAACVESRACRAVYACEQADTRNAYVWPGMDGDAGGADSGTLWMSQKIVHAELEQASRERGHQMPGSVVDDGPCVRVEARKS